MKFQRLKVLLCIVILTTAYTFNSFAGDSCVKNASKFFRSTPKYIPLSKIMDSTPIEKRYDELAKLLKFRSKMKDIGGGSPGLYEAYAHRAEDVTKLTTDILEQPIKRTSGSRNTLSKQEADRIYSALKQNSVASDRNSYKYSDEVGGGCFARAAFVHMDLSFRNFSSYNTRKIWAIGELSSGRWNYHVATAVPADDGGWWVIDTFTGVVKSDRWIKEIKNYDTKGDMMFILSPAQRMGPGRFYYQPQKSSLIPENSAMHKFPKFFGDLLESYKERDWEAFSGEVFE